MNWTDWAWGGASLLMLILVWRVRIVQRVMHRGYNACERRWRKTGNALEFEIMRPHTDYFFWYVIDLTRWTYRDFLPDVPENLT